MSKWNYLHFMKNLELSIDREIEFMIKYQLTADELFFMKLIFYAQEGHDYLHDFFSQNQLTMEPRDLLFSLQNKGIINKSFMIPDKGIPFNPQDVEFNKRVTDQFLKHSQDMGMELFNAYPLYTTINGRQFSLRNISKNFKTFDDYCWEYGKSIKWDEQKHKEIMDLLEYAKDNSMISSGICDFIISRQWETLKALKDAGMGTFDTGELI